MRKDVLSRLLKLVLAGVSATFLTGFVPQAGQRIELATVRNARAQANFRSGEVVFKAAAGLKGTVTRVVHFKSGNYGLQIEVTDGTDTEKQNQKGKKVWVYYEAAKAEGETDPGSRYMAIQDAEGKVLNGSAVAQKAKAVKTKVADVLVTKNPVEPKASAPAAVATPKAVTTKDSVTSTDRASKPAKPSKITAPKNSVAQSVFPNRTQTETQGEFCATCNQSKKTAETLPTTGQELLAMTEQAAAKVSNSEVPACFDITKDPTIRRMLAPNPRFHETEETIRQIHRLIWEHRNEVDPRIVYFHMFGESEANPNAVNPTSGAYGLFQFYGSPYGSSRSYRSILESMYRAQPGVSPRYIQVKFYLEHYLKKFKHEADLGNGCDRSKKFHQYSDIQKAAYLNWGKCDSWAIQTERNLCKRVASYRNGPCAFASNLINEKSHLRLCDAQI